MELEKSFFIRFRRWRTLLYELMDQYPNCLMLNFAVKLISDAGFQTEISTVSSAAQQVSSPSLSAMIAQ